MRKLTVVGVGLCAVFAGACSSTEEPSVEGARIYATVAGTHEVLVLDDDTHQLLSTIEVGEGPAIILATPDNQKLYTANWADDTVSAIDVATEQVTSIGVGSRPYVIAMAPAGDYLYAGLNSNQIAVIATATDTVERMIPTGTLPASIIVSPDGETLYVATLFPGRLKAMSASTGEVVHPTIAVGSVPAWITISRDGTKVFTLNFLSDDVSVIDTATWTTITTVSGGADSQGIIGNVTPDDTTLYVTNHGASNLIAIDTTSYAITQTIGLDGRPVGVNFNADGSRVYVTDFGPQSLTVPADSNYLLTGHLTVTGDGQISVFDTATGEPVGTKVQTGRGATSVVVLPQ